jgi:hypothetical protein
MDLATISLMALLMATSSHSLFERSFVDQMDRHGATIVCGNGDGYSQVSWPLPRLPLCTREGHYVRWGHLDLESTSAARSRVERLLEARERRTTGSGLIQRVQRFAF